MKIAGFQKVSLIDFPNTISSVIFTQGCNFRCGYCHNANLVLPNLFNEPISYEYIFSYLAKRINVIEGVTITGGEPTIHFDLPKFIEEIKYMGFNVKLDTNGSNPSMLQNILNNNLIDFVAMDIKAPLYKYEAMCGVDIEFNSILKSIQLIKDSKIKREFRTTVLKKILTKNDLKSIKRIINEDLVLQKFVVPKNVIDNRFDKEYELNNYELNSLNLEINCKGT